MTPLSDQDLEKLERALAEAHRSRPEPSLGAAWTGQVLRDIRREAARPWRAMASPGIARLLRRVAAIAAVLALVLAGFLVVDAGEDTVELAALLSEEVETGEPLVE